MLLYSSKLDRFSIQYPNQSEYRNLKSEIFTKDTYFFESDNPTPRIIDAGAHIGMATLYFKKLYPFSQITAIEANPAAVAICEQNLFENHCDDVEIVQAALSDSTATTKLFIDSSSSHWDSTASFSRGAWSGDQEEQVEAIEVKTVLLSDYLQQPVDFMKMDIEGAEFAVLSAAKDHLSQIKHCIIEFHTTPSQNIKQVLELLERSGFTTTVWKDNREANPDLIRGLALIEAVQERS